MKQKYKNKKIIFSVLIALFYIFSIPTHTFASDITKDGIINLVNRERTSRGLNTLIINRELEIAAQWKADDMLEKDYWEHYHNGKSPWQWMREAGYQYIDAGENLAIDFDELEPMHNAWMNSPTHRDNIINSKYKEAGVGIAKGDFEGHDTIIVVQMFGNPLPTSNQAQDSIQKAAPQSQSKLTDQFSAKADEIETTPQLQTKAMSKPTGFFSRLEGVMSWVFNKAKNNFLQSISLFKIILLPNYSVAADKL